MDTTSEIKEPTVKQIKAAQKALDDAPVPTKGRKLGYIDDNGDFILVDGDSGESVNTSLSEGYRRFSLSDVLTCLVELRANAKQAAIMSGCKQTPFSISVEELKSGMIDIPIKSKKDAAKEG